MYVEQVFGDDRFLVDTNAKVNASPYADVWLQPLEVAGVQVPQQAVMIQDQGQQPQFIASHSTGYNLVPNQLVDQIISDMATRAQTRFNHDLTIWNGKKLIERYLLPEFQLAPEDDKITLGVEGLNSYDGSTQFGIRFFMRRLLCTNGMYLDSQLGSFMFRHLGNGEWDLEDAINELRQGTERFLKLAPMFEALQRTPINLQTVLDWTSRLSEAKPAWPKSKTGLVLEALSKSTKRTAWDLLNAFTSVTSHNITPFVGAKLSNNVCDVAFSIIT